MTLAPEDKQLVAELVAAAKPPVEPVKRLRGCLVCGFPTASVMCIAHADLILEANRGAG